MDFNKIVTEHQSYLRSVASRFISDSADVDDVVQEVLIRAWEKRASFDGQSKVRTWLHAMTVNACRDFVRTRKLHQTETLTAEVIDTIPAAVPDPEQDCETSQLSEAFVAALMQVKPQHRARLLLFELEPISYEDLARLFNLPAGTVASQLYDSRRKLAPKARPYLKNRRNQPD